MKMVLIGHRGVGKSHLLERLKIYFSSHGAIKFFDLDREIEFREGKTITQIFNEIGEARFRDLERQVFHELLGGHAEFVISLGAGFSLQEERYFFRLKWVLVAALDLWPELVAEYEEKLRQRKVEKVAQVRHF